LSVRPRWRAPSIRKTGSADEAYLYLRREEKERRNIAQVIGDVTGLQQLDLRRRANRESGNPAIGDQRLFGREWLEEWGLAEIKRNLAALFPSDEARLSAGAVAYQ
jgi:hypothetical protein